jgi:hypothetical protein
MRLAFAVVAHCSTNRLFGPIRRVLRFSPFTGVSGALVYWLVKVGEQRSISMSERKEHVSRQREATEG